jgi:hypothetical protein
MYTNIKSCAQFIGFVVALVATFFVYSDIASANSLTANGLNEYIDPSQNPKYSQVYNEIIFSGDGITMEELDEINSLVNLKDNATEEPSAIVGEEIIPISKLKAGSKVKSISYSSKSDDNKISELNYYRGKDENLENKKAKRQELRDKKDKALDSSLAKLDAEIVSQEQLIQKNKANWERKAKSKKAQVDKLKTKTQTAISSSNKEIMDILYPSKENIDKLNAEILEERRIIKELGLDKIWKREDLKKKISNIFLPQAQASYLNNFISNLIIYTRSNIGLRIDLKGNGVYNGNTFHLWGANGGNAQKFKFIDSSGEIKYANNQSFCMDVDLANGRYDNGDRVHLWNCHGGQNQKWVAFPNGEIKPFHNQNFCLDASAGLNQGSTLHLWNCHGGSNQKFQIGEEDFGKFDYYIRLHASTAEYTQTNLNGHVFVSLPKLEKSNNYWRSTNTFSFWNTRDSNNSNDLGRTNNIHPKINYSGNFSYLNIDHHKDWFNGDRNLSNLGGEFGGYRRTTSGIPKQRFEEIKYMRGYDLYGYKDKAYNLCKSNCATYSVDLYNYYNKGTNHGDNYNDPDFNAWSRGILGPNCTYPGNIYKAL